MTLQKVHRHLVLQHLVKQLNTEVYFTSSLVDPTSFSRNYSQILTKKISQDLGLTNLCNVLAIYLTNKDSVFNRLKLKHS